MKLNFNVSVTGLDGRPIEDQFGRNIIAGKVLANALVMQPQGEVAKLFDWAIALHRGEIVDLDRADQNKVREFIESSNQIVILVKHCLLSIMDGKSNGVLDNKVEEVEIV